MKSKKAEQPPVLVIVLETPAPEMTPKAKKARAKRLAAEPPKSRPVPPMEGARQTRFASEVKAPAMSLNVPKDAPLPPTPRMRGRDQRLMKVKL